MGRVPLGKGRNYVVVHQARGGRVSLSSTARAEAPKMTRSTCPSEGQPESRLLGQYDDWGPRSMEAKHNDAVIQSKREPNRLN